MDISGLCSSQEEALPGSLQVGWLKGAGQSLLITGSPNILSTWLYISPGLGLVLLPVLAHILCAATRDFPVDGFTHEFNVVFIIKELTVWCLAPFGGKHNGKLIHIKQVA